MTTTIGGTTGITFPDATTQNTSPYTGGLAFRNRIINGSMMIDQRNAGAAITPVNNGFTVDRWKYLASQASKTTCSQKNGVYASASNYEAGSSPAGYVNSLKFASSSSYSVLASDYFAVKQLIEGFNVADLGWGTANAQPVTLSFWVKSSLTGTFGGAIQNYNGSRSYPISYTISAANTWEQKTVSITGDTTGTWYVNNSTGICVVFGLGVGSTYSGTAGSWAATDYESCTGATSVVGTNGATFYITGVQLEKGSTATAFDWRPYGTELQLCQRYFQITTVTTVQGVTASNYYGAGGNYTVTPRTAPTLTYLNSSASYLFPSSAGTPSPVTVNGFSYYKAANGTASGGQFMDNLSLSAEL